MPQARPSLLGPRSTRKVQPVQSSRASFLWLFSSVAMSSAPRLRRRRPPPQIVLRSAIFLIRKGASRPPAGSAARARPGRAPGPWGRYYYGIVSRSRRRGPVNARRAAGDKMPLLLNKLHRNASRATERFLAVSSFRFVAASASRDAARRARDVASRSAPVVCARDGPHHDFLEDVGGGSGGASTARGRGDGAGGASSTRGESARGEAGHGARVAKAVLLAADSFGGFALRRHHCSSKFIAMAYRLRTGLHSMGAG